VHDVHYQGNLTPLNTTPTFDHGYLVVFRCCGPAGYPRRKTVRVRERF
jgi:hypothetical protein